MRKWKDEGKDILSAKQRKRYLIISIVLVLFPLAKSIFIHKLYVFDLITIILGMFLIWGIKFDGFYKIARKVAEHNMKKRDNHWRNYR